MAAKLPPDATLIDAIYELEFRQAFQQWLAQVGPFDPEQWPATINLEKRVHLGNHPAAGHPQHDHQARGLR